MYTALLVDLDLYWTIYCTVSEAARQHAAASFPFPVMRRLFENISRPRASHLHANNVGREVIHVYSNRDLWLRRLSQMNNIYMTVDASR